MATADDHMEAAQESLKLAETLVGKNPMSDREFLETMARSDDSLAPLRLLAKKVVDEFIERKSVEWCSVKPNVGLMLNRLVNRESPATLERFMQWDARDVLGHLLKMIAAKTISGEDDIKKLFAEIDGLLEKP